MAKLKDGFFALFVVSVYMLLLSGSIFSVKAFAEERGGAGILSKEDVGDFEKLTFYKSNEKNLIGTIPEGEESYDNESYSWLEDHRIVSTEEGDVVAEYGRIGQFHGRNINIRITFTDFVYKPETFAEKERNGKLMGIPKTFRGDFEYDGNSLVQKLVFYYSDDPAKTPIDMSKAFIVINSLNTDEYAGMEPGHKAYLSEYSTLEYKEVNGYCCYGNGAQPLSDDELEGTGESRKKEWGGVYYDDVETNEYYNACSVMFMLGGTENKIYIEDKRETAGYGIKWCLDLSTLNVKYKIKTRVENGRITEDISGISYNTDQRVCYSPDENYVLESITVDNTPIDISTAAEYYDFKNITRDHEIYVVYKLPYKRIITEVVNGVITPSDENILFGADKKIEYSPGEGYVLDSITVDDKKADPEKFKKGYSFTCVKEDHLIKVVYSKPEAPVKKVLDKNGDYINGKNVMPGDILTYEISYKNPLERQAQITITDSIPPHTEFVSASDKGKMEEGKAVWELTGPPKAEGKVQLNVKVKESAKGNVLTNYALMDLEDINLMSNKVDNTVLEKPGLSIVDEKGREINNTVIKKGQEVTYMISLINPALEEKTVTVRDRIPEGMDFISADNNGKPGENEVIWECTLRPKEEKKVSVKVKPASDDKTFINQASFSMGDLNYLSNKTENWTMKKPVKEVKQDGESVNGKNISDGETVTYYITVKNPSSRKREIKIEDEVSEHLEITNINNGGSEDDNNIIWELEGVEPGESRVVSFDAKTKGDEDPHNVKNTAYITINNTKLATNEVGIKIPAVKRIEIKPDKAVPLQDVSPNSGVLGERKILTGDDTDIPALILAAMLSLSGIVIVRIKNV